MPYVSLSRMVVAAWLLAGTAAVLAGCGEQASGGSGNGGSGGSGGTSQPPGTSAPHLPAPPAQARQVYFDPSDLRTPEFGVLLTDPAQVTKFVSWLNTKPRPGMASPRLIAALTAAPPTGDQALLVVSRLVGCDSVGKVELRQQGANFSLAALDVEHHEECLRPNVLVAAFSVPKDALPANPTIDGAAPDTDWQE